MGKFDFSAIKLVVWDLDDTFWRGTLTEGGITPRADTRDALIALARHGIISSIASNNDLAPVRRKLEELKLWHYFVFARADWSSKADQVSSIIKAMQLRPQNVVFLDDKDRIRAEVAAAVPGLLATMPVEEFLELRSDPAWPALPWKDIELERLSHYRLLERKHVARSGTGDARAQTESEFLRECRIACRIDHDLDGQVERIHELINRTNQLNFTQHRMPAIEAVRALVEDPDRSSAIVHVRDKFGSYGICGFYSMSKSTGVLDHFLFSCRVLNMGVEQALYRHLGQPGIRAAEGCTTEPAALRDEGMAGDWVEITTQRGATGEAAAEAPRAAARKRVHFTGGCDITPLAALCQSRYGDALEIGTQLSLHNDEGTWISCYGASALLRLAAAPGLVAEHLDVLDRIPWLDRSCLVHPIFSKERYDAYVISAVRDGLFANYRYRDTELVIPGEYFRAGRKDLTRPENWDAVARRINRRSGPHPAGFREFFQENFRFEGVLDAAAYERHLEWLVAQLPAGSRLICLNLSEVGTGYAHLNTRSAGWMSFEDMAAEAEHHKTINRVLDEVASRHPAMCVVDVRRHVRSAADALDLNHYTRRASMAQWGELAPHLESLGRSGDPAAAPDAPASTAALPPAAPAAPSTAPACAAMPA